jgi:hypothetical protein
MTAGGTANMMLGTIKLLIDKFGIENSYIIFSGSLVIVMIFKDICLYLCEKSKKNNDH